MAKDKDIMYWSDRYDKMFNDVDEYLDYCEGEGDEPEETLDEASKNIFRFEKDAVEIFEKFVEDMMEDDDYSVEDWDYEDYASRLDGIEEFINDMQAAIDKFNKAQKGDI